MIEKQEAKRQVLKKRAEQTKVDSDTEINWDDDEDDVENEQDIPGRKSNPETFRPIMYLQFAVVLPREGKFYLNLCFLVPAIVS